MNISTIEGFETEKTTNPVKMRWEYKLRNVFLVALLSMFIIYVFGFLINPQGYFEFELNYFLSGIPLNIIFTAFFIYYIWKYLNNTKGENPGPARTDISGWIVMAFLFSSGIYIIFTGKALPFPFDFVLNAFFSSGFIDSIIMYPMILFWERKNMMTIYFVEDKSFKLRPVAIPDQVLQRLE